MKVAIIIPRIVQLGPIKVIEALVNTLVKEKDIHIEVYYLNKDVDNQINMKVPTKKFSLRNFCFSEFDIIHTTGIRPDLLAFLYRRRIKYHISTIHNFVFTDLAFTYNRFISLIFGYIWLIIWKRADKLVCVSATMKVYYEKWFCPSKLEVIHNGISLNQNYLMPDRDIVNEIENFRSRGLKIIGTASILTKRKGIEQVLNLISMKPEYAFVVIGDGKEYKKLVRIAKQLKISDRCLFCGFRSQAKKYFSLFDIFVSPSRSEGFGLALVEAVQQMVPVICSDLKVFKELFNSNEITFFKLDDKLSLIQALKTSEKNGKEKCKSAIESAKNKYSPELMAENYYKLYRSFSA